VILGHGSSVPLDMLRAMRDTTQSPAPRTLYRTLRRQARRPAVRRVLQPIIGQAYRLRNRRLSVKGRWERAIGWEVTYWDEWLGSDDARRMLDPEMPVDTPLLAEAFDKIAAEEILIVDVGAGPITPVGKTFPGKRLKVVATDALAAEYDEILARAAVEPPVRTVYAEAERLSSFVAPGSADVVFCQNALDHCFDPAEAVSQMVEVARPGGIVALTHFENEGESQRYLGLHQWNIAERQGNFVIWNQDETRNVSAELSDRATVDVRRLRRGDRWRVETLITKL
jgi:SAM-dependent methyltransferase